MTFKLHPTLQDNPISAVHWFAGISITKERTVNVADIGVLDALVSKATTASRCRLNDIESSRQELGVLLIPELVPL